MPFVKRHRTYYKYDWEDYSLPKMTSNTTPGGKLTYDIGIGGPYATDIYPVFWGGSGISINGLYNQATRYLNYTFAKLLKAGKYTFTYKAYKQNNVTNNLNKWEAILEDDSRVEIMNPTITTSSQTFTAEFEVDKPIKAINLTLYASAPAEASCYYLIDKISLTGEGLTENTVKAAEIVAGTSTDYDYHVDSNKLYQLAANKRTYYKRIYQSFIQPVLRSDGVLGGDKFACQMLENPVNSAYLAFDGNKSTNARINRGASSSSSFTFYNPNPLKISTIIINGGGNNNNEYMSAGKLYGSNDNSSWTELMTFSGLSYSDYTLNVNSDSFYKYFKIMPTSLCSSGYWTLAELIITAEEHATIEINLNGEDVWEDWEQPVLSANGTMGGNKFAANEVAANSSYPAYKVFDGTRSDLGSVFTKASGYLEFYNPVPLKVSSLSILNWAGDSYGVRSIKAGYIQASNDGTEYKTIKEFTNDIVDGGQSWNIDLSDNDAGYKYYRIVATDTSYVHSDAVNQAIIAEVTITAQTLKAVGGTIEDADTYTDRLVSYAPIVRGKRSYYKQADKQRDTGTYTFTLNKDYTAKLLFVGNGGGGCSSQKDSRWHVSSGGSGACFEGTVRLPADTYTLTIGSLGYGNNANNTHYHSSSVVSTDSFLTNSAGQELIRVGAGGNGYTSVGGVGGAAGVLTLGTLDILETKKATDGVYTAGNVSTGSLSAYDNTYTGYGAGTSGTHGQGNVYGIAGIFDLVLETDINDYTYYEDVGTKIY